MLGLYNCTNFHKTYTDRSNKDKSEKSGTKRVKRSLKKTETAMRLVSEKSKQNKGIPQDKNERHKKKSESGLRLQEFSAKMMTNSHNQMCYVTIVCTPIENYRDVLVKP